MNPKPEKPRKKRSRATGRPALEDTVHPTDFRRYIESGLGGFFCDSCSHFSSRDQRCTIGYAAIHTADRQIPLYNRSGRLVLCRSIEID